MKNVYRTAKFEIYTAYREISSLSAFCCLLNSEPNIKLSFARKGNYYFFLKPGVLHGSSWQTV